MAAPITLEELIKLAEQMIERDKIQKGYSASPDYYEGAIRMASFFLKKLKDLQNQMAAPPIIPFYIDEITELLRQHKFEELSPSRLTEMLNERATGLSAMEIYKIRNPNN